MPGSGGSARPERIIARTLRLEVERRVHGAVRWGMRTRGRANCGPASSVDGAVRAERASRAGRTRRERSPIASSASRRFSRVVRSGQNAVPRSGACRGRRPRSAVVSSLARQDARTVCCSRASAGRGPSARHPTALTLAVLFAEDLRYRGVRQRAAGAPTGLTCAETSSSCRSCCRTRCVAGPSTPTRR